MPCVLAVSPKKTKDGRSVCARTSQICEVSKGVGVFHGLDLCAYHRGRLQCLGFKVEPIKPYALAIEKGSVKKHRRRRKTLKCGNCNDGVLRTSSELETHFEEANRQPA